MKLNSQKAINIIRRIRKEWHFDKHEQYEALAMAIKVLEKQIPKKSAIQKDDLNCIHYICPQCKNEHNELFSFKHCPNCGQALKRDDTP